MTTSAMPSAAASSPAAALPAGAAKKPATNPSEEGLASQSVFLQLLVAQLKNQDPQNPADGTQFITQLAQFTTLEQTTMSRSDLDQILTVMQSAAAAAAQPAVTVPGNTPAPTATSSDPSET